MAATHALTHAFLQSKEGDRLEFTYNPAEVTMTKSSQWKTEPQRNAKKAPKSEFTGTGPRGLKMQVVLFDRVGAAPTVESSITKLFEWTNPTTSSRQQNKPQPPLLVLHWGDTQYFECFLASVSAKYTLFDQQGTPLKALVDLTLTETPMSAENQNPTSGGVPGRRSRTLVAGESLHSVAYDEYGRAGHWRALAAANGIDDPLRVRPGTVLLVPTQLEADALA